jgi:protein involved in polysaccharide export with SLBB domain
MLRRRGLGRVGRPGLVGTVARTAVVAGTATAVAGGMSRRQQAKAQQAADADAYRQQQEQAQMEQQAPPPPPPPAAPASDTDAKLAQLTQLGELKAQGVLTEAEFEAQKAAILGS